MSGAKQTVMLEFMVGGVIWWGICGFARLCFFSGKHSLRSVCINNAASILKACSYCLGKTLPNVLAARWLSLVEVKRQVSFTSRDPVTGPCLMCVTGTNCLSFVFLWASNEGVEIDRLEIDLRCFRGRLNTKSAEKAFGNALWKRERESTKSQICNCLSMALGNKGRVNSSLAEMRVNPAKGSKQWDAIFWLDSETEKSTGISKLVNTKCVSCMILHWWVLQVIFKWKMLT